MDVEFESDLSNTEDEEIDDSGTIRPYMYEPVRRESDKDSDGEDVKNSPSEDMAVSRQSGHAL